MKACVLLPALIKDFYHDELPISIGRKYDGWQLLAIPHIFM